MNAKTYDIYLVENGRLADFRRGILGNGYPNECKRWGNDMGIDELRQRYRELGQENFCRDEGDYDRIALEAENYEDGLTEDEEDRRRKVGLEAADAALAKYLDELTSDADPLKWPRIEWHNDLKWVCACEHIEG